MPSTEDVARLEAALARHPCIGDLGLWERNYRFSRKTGLLSPYSLDPDLDIIEFHLRRAGTFTISPGREVVRWRENDDWPDSGTVRSIDGRFRITDGELILSPCRPVEAG